MKPLKAYVIMLVGKNDESVQSGTQKALVFQHQGFFYSVVVRWLMP